jgi:hypothetical protein
MASQGLIVALGFEIPGDRIRKGKIDLDGCWPELKYYIP